MDYEAYVAQVDAHGTALAAAAERCGLPAAVPTCPEWDVRALLDHVGMVHRWATAHVRDGGSGTQPPLEHAPEEGVLDWFRAGHAALVETLNRTAPDAPCWAFLAGAPRTASFWARRQAHETAVHRADAEAALGVGSEFDAKFALDGIAELLEGFFGRPGGRLIAHPPFTMRIAPSDAELSWLVAVRPDGREITRNGTGPADCTLSGASADLYLHLWNRIPSAPVGADGDSAVLDRWRELACVSWS
jgi:uncharacterized protein (TIGR03083 family)